MTRTVAAVAVFFVGVYGANALYYRALVAGQPLVIIAAMVVAGGVGVLMGRILVGPRER